MNKIRMNGAVFNRIPSERQGGSYRSRRRVAGLFSSASGQNRHHREKEASNDCRPAEGCICRRCASGARDEDEWFLAQRGHVVFPGNDKGY